MEIWTPKSNNHPPKMNQIQKEIKLKLSRLFQIKIQKLLPRKLIIIRNLCWMRFKRKMIKKSKKKKKFWRKRKMLKIKSLINLKAKLNSWRKIKSI